jgi:hypothetical protein
MVRLGGVPKRATYVDGGLDTNLVFFFEFSKFTIFVKTKSNLLIIKM